jgi:hypothetical protein
MTVHSEKNYKLFITDLDGTLLDDQKNIPVRNRQAIQKLVDHKIHCTVFTGRSYHSGVDIVRELGIQIPVVFQNGAMIMNPSSKEIIFQQGMHRKMAAEIIMRGRKQSFLLIAYVSFLKIPDMLVEVDPKNPFPGYSSDSFPFQSYLAANQPRILQVDDLYHSVLDGHPSIQMEKDGIPQVCVIGEIQLLNQFAFDLEKQFSGQISPIISTILDGIGFLEIFGPNISKGHALDELLKYYHVTPEETVFIGDNLNDVELMKRVGMPIAVANAPGEVQALCRWIAPSNEDTGVASAIERFFFERKDP